MLIVINGKPDNVPTALCRQALYYFGAKLLSPRLNDNISIRVDFVDKLEAKNVADCVWTDKPAYGRCFHIRLLKALGKRKMLLALAHEMVHVKQWATGELSDYQRNFQKCKWLGKVYHLPDQDRHDRHYWLQQPWEIDARGREIGLYKTFIKEPIYVRRFRRRI